MATILGLLAALTLFVYALYFGTGGEYMLFVDLPAMAIVGGGVTAAMLICFPLFEVFKAMRSALLVFKKDKFKFELYIGQMTSLAKKVQEVKSFDGIDVSTIKDSFVRDGLQMLKDAIHSSEDIREILETRISYRQNRENAEAHIFLTAAKIAPAFGMVGTLIGMIDMLQKMSGDMSGVGRGMSVALVATFYGVVLSNLIFTPIAEKLLRRTEEDVIFKMMIVEGIVLLNEYQHPFVIEDRLNSYVPVKKRQDSTSLEGLNITLKAGE